MSTKQLHDVDMERALLGSLLIDPAQILAVLQVEPDDFYLKKHGWLYEALRALHLAHAPIDPVIVCDELEAHGRLEAVGGAAYITELMNAVPSALHAEAYASRVIDLATRRRLLGEASAFVRAVHDLSVPVEQVVAAATAALAQSVRSRARFVDTAAVAEALHDQALRWRADPDPDGIRGLRTGLHALDRHLGGLDVADLVVVAARPGVGKTSLACHVARTVAEAQERVAVFSLEMTASELLRRMACAEARVSLQALRMGTLDDEAMYRYSTACEHLRALTGRLMISDATGLTSAAIVASCASLNWPRLVVVDHLNLIADRDDNQVRRLGTITQNLKDLAKDGRCTVLLLHQLSRWSEWRADKRPTLADLRDSGRIEENADVVLGLYKPDRPNLLEITVLKNRDGPTERCSVYFNRAFTQLSDLAREVDSRSGQRYNRQGLAGAGPNLTRRRENEQ